jgi:hypothetical protein
VRTPADGLAVSRAWEIRDDILRAISAFRGTVEAASSSGRIDISGVG